MLTYSSVSAIFMGEIKDMLVSSRMRILTLGTRHAVSSKYHNIEVREGNRNDWVVGLILDSKIEFSVKSNS
jgi:hypothetical protein